MKDTINFSNRHLSVDAMLQAAYRELKDSGNLTKFSVLAANKCDVHPYTVKNYLLGSGKDGYLKDEILKLLKLFNEKR
jgi:hypothetical protein